MLENRYINSFAIDWEKISEHSYLREIGALHKVKELQFDSNIVLFSGENGTGKSTLLEALAVAYGFNAEGGTMNYNFSTYEESSELASSVSLKKGYKRPQCSYFLRAESFYNVATKAEEYESRYGSRSLHNRSHGESFFDFLTSFRGEGIFLMDEPEAALSPQSQLTLLIHIQKMAARGSQFIIASHSPILLGMPNSRILSFDGEEGIQECKYEETGSYQVTELFMNNREHMLEQLLRED